MCDCHKCTKDREHREFMRDLNRRLEKPRKDPKPRDLRKLHLNIQPDGKSYDTFCIGCWRHERFFEDGHSWTPDPYRNLCACGCEDTTVWCKMGPIKRRMAQKKYDKDLVTWQKKIKRNQ